VPFDEHVDSNRFGFAAVPGFFKIVLEMFADRVACKNGFGRNGNLLAIDDALGKSVLSDQDGTTIGKF
jgi:hypothetical protein